MTSIYANADFQNVILTILACVILAVLLWCIYTFIRAIFFFIFAGTKEDYKKKWWSSIRFMIIGMIMTVLLLFLVSPILKLMHVPQYTTYTSKNVINKAGDVLEYIFKLGNVIKKSQEESQYRGQMYFDTTPDLQEPSSTDYQL